MIDPTVTQFYLKNPHEAYIDTYEIHHGERLDNVVARCGLAALRAPTKVADVGGGLGFIGRRLDPSVEYWVFDGAEHPVEKRVCKGTWTQCDIQRFAFGPAEIDPAVRGGIRTRQFFDVTLCLETLEHLSDPYHCLVQIKAMTKEGGDIIVSTPTETVWHNVVYPGLLWPQPNWEQFLGQMALPILDRWTYTPSPNRGWPAYCYRCSNAPWSASRMLYPKSESKFHGVTPLQMTNL